MKDPTDRKLFSSMGPWHIYMKLSLLCFYRPTYWRKVCRMLNNLRRMNHNDFKDVSRGRMIKYGRAAYRDTKLPRLIKWTLADCIRAEFELDVTDPGLY